MMAAASYTDFLQSKLLVVPNAGKDVPADQINPHLFPFQQALTRYALRKGRSACWASTGLGKTRIALAFAEHAAERVLMLCPLAVAHQTIREGEKVGVPVTYARRQDQSAREGVTVTNYEMMDGFDAAAFGAVILDESSILKAQDGKTKTRLIEKFRNTPYKLCLTATPAPNDREELCNHAEFLGVMTRQEMLSAFFIHDDAGWRLKRHGQSAFYRWLASWGMTINKPSDLGFSDAGYDLPPLEIEPVFVDTDYTPAGKLFALDLKGVTERASVRRGTLRARVDTALTQIQAEPAEPWLCWYGLLEEGRELKKALGAEAVFVEGSLSPEEKEARLLQFLNGEARVLISHPLIAGFGLNLQHCARMSFVGLGDSYEQYFQCIRRSWRFGQTRPVKVFIVLSEPERPIYENVLRKEREAHDLAVELVAHVKEFEREEILAINPKQTYRPERPMKLPGWLTSPAGTPHLPAHRQTGQCIQISAADHPGPAQS